MRMISSARSALLMLRFITIFPATFCSCRMLSQTVALARCHRPLLENVVFCTFAGIWRREPKMQAPGAVRYSLTSVRDVLRLSIC